MDKKKKTYTAIDFARYYDGHMEAKEMHELEKAALVDPFLADALEGYMHTSSAVEDVQHIKSLLTEKTVQKKVRSIASVSRNVWWRVAAIFILIGVAGYFFFDMGEEEERTMAKNEWNHMDQSTGQILSSDSDTTVTTPEKEKREVDYGSLQMNQTEDKESKESVARLNHLSTHTQKQLTAPLPENFSLQKRIEDTPLSVSDYAPLENKSTDGNQIVSVSVLNADSPMRSFQKGEAVARSVSKNNEELSKVGATETRRKNQSAKVAPVYSSERISNVIIPSQSKLLPIEGVENFSRYISKNMEEKIDENMKSLHGSIELEFYINKEGKPINIRVLKSDCPPCEKHAIALLENGPLWKGDMEERGEISFLFFPRLPF
ncbi:MAG: hypothetical protein ABIN48_01255 [Ginsengibacter sp.]